MTRPATTVAVPGRALSLAELSSALGPGRTVIAFSRATGRRLGMVTMTVPAVARLGGSDGAHIRGRGINTALPVTGLLFIVKDAH